MNRSPITRQTPLRSRSAAREARAGDREAVRQFCIRRDGGCVAAHLIPSVHCSGRLDPHEPQRGADKYDADRVLTLCRQHHEWVHRNVEQSRELGLLVHRWQEWSYEGHWKGWGE